MRRKEEKSRTLTKYAEWENYREVKREVERERERERECVCDSGLKKKIGQEIETDFTFNVSM